MVSQGLGVWHALPGKATERPADKDARLTISALRILLDLDQWERASVSKTTHHAESYMFPSVWAEELCHRPSGLDHQSGREKAGDCTTSGTRDTKQLPGLKGSYTAPVCFFPASLTLSPTALSNL